MRTVRFRAYHPAGGELDYHLHFSLPTKRGSGAGASLTQAVWYEQNGALLVNRTAKFDPARGCGRRFRFRRPIPRGAEIRIRSPVTA